MTTTGHEPTKTVTPPGPELDGRLRSLERGRPFRLGLAIGAVVSVAAVLLVVQNGHSTGVGWLWFDVEMPLWLLLVVTLAIGVVLGEAARLVWHRARTRGADRQRTLSTARRRLRSH